VKTKYVPPEFEARQFHCVLCHVFASQSWSHVYIHPAGNAVSTGFQACLCSHCKQWSFWYDGKLVVPSDVPVEPAHTDLPGACAIDYTEARDVFSRSPRASAALLRLCIQKLMPHLGEQGANINADIKSLVSKGLPVAVQHLFSMINFIVEDRISRPKEIERLYGLLPEAARQAIEKRDEVQ